MTFLIPFAIQPKQRPRAGKYGIYTPKETKLSEKAIANVIKLQMQESNFKTIEKTNPCFLRISYYFHNSKKAGQYHCQKPDLDNLDKTILDACTKLLYHDDCQVVKKVVSKQFTDGDTHVVITCKELSNEN